ncbi:arsenate-mycothiol transferase ArsC [Natrialbaceae archaeon A-gly3]
MTESSDRIQLAFVCVQNAGRSQMAYAFAQREVTDRGLSDKIDLVTGGTRPADSVHDEVVRAMHAVDIDISERTPREVTFEEIQDSEYVITMGCSADDVCPAGWAGENRDWGLDDPDGQSTAKVGRIRDEIERRVTDLFDEIEST